MALGAEILHLLARMEGSDNVSTRRVTNIDSIDHLIGRNDDVCRS
jgi:hypothetical protein